MTTETISGKCPCCGYEKMIMRYGSTGWYLFEGCPNCGFGYGTDHQDKESEHVDAWIAFAGHYIESHSKPETIYLISSREREDDLRRKIFQWAEKQERFNDVEATLFQYDNDYIEAYRQTNPLTFRRQYGIFYNITRELQI